MTSRPDEQRFGASLDVRFEQPIDGLFAHFANLGLSHVELRQGYLDVNSIPDSQTLANLLERYGLTASIHAPHRNWSVSNLNEPLRQAAVDGVKRALDMADAIDAVGVVVHGGASTERFPDHVNEHERRQAVTSLRECARHAEQAGVPLCLENQRQCPGVRRHTATPDRFRAFIDDIGVDSEFFKLTLDVGHAKASTHPASDYVEEFGERIHLVHLHDNDGTADDHDPLPDFRSVAKDIGAPYNVLEMKSLEDIHCCVGQSDLHEGTA